MKTKREVLFFAAGAVLAMSGGALVKLLTTPPAIAGEPAKKPAAIATQRILKTRRLDSGGHNT